MHKWLDLPYKEHLFGEDLGSENPCVTKPKAREGNQFHHPIKKVHHHFNIKPKPGIQTLNQFIYMYAFNLIERRFSDGYYL